MYEIDNETDIIDIDINILNDFINLIRESEGTDDNSTYFFNLYVFMKAEIISIDDTADIINYIEDIIDFYENENYRTTVSSSVLLSGGSANRWSLNQILMNYH